MNERFVLVANPGCKRVEAFSKALHQFGLHQGAVVSYSDLLAGTVQLSDVVQEGDRVRLESPGRDWDIEKRLLMLGSASCGQEGRFRYLEQEAVEALKFEKGRIWPSRQWYFGFEELMQKMVEQLRECKPHVCTHKPVDILTFFDKPKCQGRLKSAVISVPPSLPTPANFEEFMVAMRSVGWQRAFLKLAHGSSAAGVLAFQFSGSRVKAVSTTEFLRVKRKQRLYNSRKLQVYETWSEVEVLIDALCQERLQVERWFPKASLHGMTCDARIVMIGGKVWGGITRLSQIPFTNLHLLNERAPLDDLRRAMRPADWEAMCQSCEAAMALFPDTLCAGIDVAFSPGFRSHVILEINAWGDLLPGVEVGGRDTYQAQIEAAIARS